MPEQRLRTNPLKLDRPCYNCGSHKFWLRDRGMGKPEWVCSLCHPCPYTENITWHEIDESK